MAEPINLNKARKAKARADKAAKAAQNRITFGTPKHLRDQTRAETEKQDKHLDNAKRDRPET